MCTPVHLAILDTTGVGAGTNLLDIGCVAGFALPLLARRDTHRPDLTTAMLDIAHERVPDPTLRKLLGGRRGA